MKRKNAESIGMLIRQYMRQTGLESPLNEYRLIQSWQDVLGPVVAAYTGDLFIKNQTLYVHITSPVIRQELLMRRDMIKNDLNTHVGAQVIVNIVFR